MERIAIILILCMVGLVSCNSSNAQKEIPEEVEETKLPDFKGDIKVLSLNTWQEGSIVDGGFQAVADVIVQTDADIVMLSEIRNYNNTIFSKRILDELKSRGSVYYSYNSGKSPLLLSKFQIVSNPSLNSTSLAKCIIKLDENTQIAVYAAHLDYTHYACYLPRGYNGITWEKLPSPILDVDKILKQNIDSKRDEAIAIFVDDALKEKDKGNLVLLGGDFNEPSHLDWTEVSKNLFDHNGTVVPWHNSITLKEKGFVDSYREKYPNPVTHPGITWPANNTNVELSKLIWAAEADERDRIDFIYYHPENNISLKNVTIVGPMGAIVKSERVATNPGEDQFIEPKGIWPSDHKGVLAVFDINN
ncbi:endonuclease/exonuclease/phosphatase family protein [Aureibaculum sp. 2210JD6-5]|uniref:endonuclease/exonuclease/phosphatase family protein n=1 Tax=Aureibaculum sp. 2210JD6-5 TaxID=3103957 RepID=UPI002AACCD46|nr:endonuclease/exonuclease/phosphatase family protein [Aureibaculum sp. 2210JD6-5]MDY7395151.1 endonuclease/exonuclease/phosphatase family protein [Aureibaculum sp. 2210JD6-5]